MFYVQLDHCSFSPLIFLLVKGYPCQHSRSAFIIFYLYLGYLLFINYYLEPALGRTASAFAHPPIKFYTRASISIDAELSRRRPLLAYCFCRAQIAGAGFEPASSRLWAWRAAELLHPVIILYLRHKFSKLAGAALW